MIFLLGALAGSAVTTLLWLLLWFLVDLGFLPRLRGGNPLPPATARQLDRARRANRPRIDPPWRN